MITIVNRKGGTEYRDSMPQSPKGQRWFNRLLHSLNLPDSALGRTASIAALAFANLGSFALFVPHDSQAVFALVFGCALLGDVLLLLSLPHLRISYGPFTDQLVVINVPRGAVSLGAALAASVSDVGFWLLVIGQTLGSVIYFYGMLFEPSGVTVSRRHVNSGKINTGLSFIHLSDLHIERITRREDQTASLIADAFPDFIFLTGDYLNLSNIADREAQAHLGLFLRGLKARYGIFASMGSPPVDDRPTLQGILESAGVTVLRDQSLELILPGGDRINVIGADCDHRQKLDSQVAAHLVANVDPSLFTILLFHSPEIMPFVRDLPVDVYLCGHTHGGQVRAPLYGAIITSSVTGKKYEMGPYVEHGTTLYVSRGLGLEGQAAPRIRLLCRPEAIIWQVDPERAQAFA